MLWIGSSKVAMDLVLASTVVLAATVSPFGVYSNMRALDGDVSGFELFLIPSQSGDFLLFQMAEGMPVKPHLLEASIGGTRASEGIPITFTHPEMGPFEGTITSKALEGRFTRIGLSLTLPKRPSLWQ
jgi:hypothetical protein